MNWKADLHLADLPPETILEITCHRCGLIRTTPAGIIRRNGACCASMNSSEACAAQTSDAAASSGWHGNIRWTSKASSVGSREQLLEIYGMVS